MDRVPRERQATHILHVRPKILARAALLGVGLSVAGPAGTGGPAPVLAQVNSAPSTAPASPTAAAGPGPGGATGSGLGITPTVRAAAGAGTTDILPPPRGTPAASSSPAFGSGSVPPAPGTPSAGTAAAFGATLAPAPTGAPSADVIEGTTGAASGALAAPPEVATTPAAPPQIVSVGPTPPRAGVSAVGDSLSPGGTAVTTPAPTASPTGASGGAVGAGAAPTAPAATSPSLFPFQD